jgi:hypothetical protein
MNGFKIRQFVVVRVYAHAKEEPGITTVNDLVIPELHMCVSNRKVIGLGARVSGR